KERDVGRTREHIGIEIAVPVDGPHCCGNCTVSSQRVAVECMLPSAEHVGADEHPCEALFREPVDELGECHRCHGLRSKLYRRPRRGALAHSNEAEILDGIIDEVEPGSYALELGTQLRGFAVPNLS